jgi:hypothetical protein
MTPERFAQLADTYGADLKRWPQAEREAARRVSESGNPIARSALQRAAWLDRQLDSHRVALPDPRLTRDVVASAFLTARPSFWSRYGEWLSSLGFVGVGLAGIATGMLVVSLSLPLSGSPDLLPSVFDHAEAEQILGLDAEEVDQ